MRGFIGNYTHALDAKGRLTIPAQFRPALEEGLIITRGFDPCIVLYPPEEWDRLAAKVRQLPSTDPAARSFSRLIFGEAFNVVPDKMGRVIVPLRLRQYANIIDEAIIIGNNTIVEVWSSQYLREADERAEQDNAAIMKRMLDQGV